MLSDKSKKYIRWSGTGLSALAVIFVIVKLREYGNEIDVPLFVAMTLPIVSLSVVYGFASVLLALAWKDLLRHFGEHVDSRLAISIYGESQLAKYVPGNVFQFFGRQALGLEAGLPAWSLAKSAVWELGLLAVAGSTFVTVVLPALYSDIPVSFALALLAMVVLTFTGICYRWSSHLVARALILHIAFLILTAFLFLTLLFLIVPANTISGSLLVIFSGSYIVAWLLGFATPGAPAGLGIREVVLFALLSPFVREVDLLAAIIIWRIVTVGGDILFFLFALVLNVRTAKIT